MKQTYLAAFMAVFLTCTYTVRASDSKNFISQLKQSAAVVRLANGQAAPAYVQVARKWEGDFCQVRITNTGSAAVRLNEVILGAVGRVLPSSTPFYAEGFQMLSQSSGTLAKPINLGNYSDAGHYKIPQPEGYLAVYNLLRLYPKGDQQLLLGFTSGRR